MPSAIRSAYLATEGLEATLETALQRQGVTIADWHGRLALSPDPPVHCPWSQDTWLAPEEHATASVKSASDALRATQRNWSNYAAAHHRRTALIQARLPPVKAAPLRFPAQPPAAPLGAWTLLSPDHLLATREKSTPVPNGEYRFEENHIGPPSRAYLKLWEALTRLGDHPGPGDDCIDLGAAPGGWTWVLAMLGAHVTAIDKAPLAEAVASLPNVAHSLESAFALAPRPVDWLVCDVIAYPARTLALLEAWLPYARCVVCTVKFQGETDHDMADRIAGLPGVSVVHLFHNKHEMTVLKREPADPSDQADVVGQSE